MQPEFAFLCDYAEEAGGKIHAVGIGWDTIYAAQVPATHSVLAFVARLRGTTAERGSKEVSIRLLDADGSDVIPPLERAFSFEPKANTLVGYMNLVIQLGGIQLKKYGSYAVHLVVQGNEMAAVSFQVSEPPTTA